MIESQAETRQEAIKELEATVKLLALPPGVYAFSVEGGAPGYSANEPAVPAMQLGLAPMHSEGTIEFLPGAGTLDRWLTRSTDMFIIRISGGSVSLLLTSVRYPGADALTINVERIETEPDPASQQPGAPALMMAHVENFGDIYFKDGRAGFSGHKLRIEAFAILSAGSLESNAIEYRGVTADGFQTPWLSDQMLCGSRGRGIPITGYAVRLKPEFAPRLDCVYSGTFLSGKTAGPFRNGDLCTSSVPGDPLQTIELHIAEREGSQTGKPGL